VGGRKCGGRSRFYGKEKVRGSSKGANKALRELSSEAGAFALFSWQQLTDLLVEADCLVHESFAFIFPSKYTSAVVRPPSII
jgi:hypothetical protein